MFQKVSEQLMKEESQGVSIWRPKGNQIFDYKTIIGELASFKCDYYDLPVSSYERFMLSFLKRVINFLPFKPILIEESGIHPKWKVVTQYLYTKKITSKKEFIFGSRENGFPLLYFAYLPFINDALTTDGHNLNSISLGAWHTERIAFSKSVGELLERVFLSRFFLKDFLRASVLDIKRNNKRYLSIEKMTNFSISQKKNSIFYFDETTLFHWVKTKNIFSGEEVLVPSQMVFWGFNIKKAEEPILYGLTTSGGGAYFTQKGAILSALYELVQRDAVLIYWLNFISPKKIQTETIPDQLLQEQMTILRNIGVETYFLDTTSDINIPTVTCVLVDRGTDEVKVCLAPATGFDTMNIIRNAFYESIAVHRYFMNSSKTVVKQPYEPFTDSKIGKDARLNFWRGDDVYEKFKFFLSGDEGTYNDFMKKGRYFENEIAEYEYATGLIKDKGYDMYVYSADNEVLTKLSYYVAKVVIPELVPLYLNEHLAPIAMKRIKEAPPLLGYTSAKELNPWPHPIP